MNEKIPKYITVSKEIIDDIKSGALQPGDKTPSENELIEKYNISNTTARKSLLRVETEGWAKRIKGKGTFVLNKTQDKHVTRALGSIYATREGFDENLIREGFTPKNIILEKSTIEAGISAEIDGLNYIMEGPVLKIHRLRYANELLMKDETRYISMKICPKINMLETQKSYFAIYEEEYKLVFTDIKQTLSATILEPNSSDHYFETEVPLPIFVLDSIVFSSGNKIVEIEKSYYRGDKYKFSILAKPGLKQFF